MLTLFFHLLRMPLSECCTFVVCIFHFQHAHAFCWNHCCSSSLWKWVFGFFFISFCFIIHLPTTSQQMHTRTHEHTQKRRLFMAASDSLYDKFFPKFFIRSLHLMRFQLELFRFGDFLISFFIEYFRLSVNEFTTFYSCSFDFLFSVSFSELLFFSSSFVKFHWQRCMGEKLVRLVGWVTI